MGEDGERRGPGRPPAASRMSVEHAALSLMTRDGYDAVSVSDISAAANIGRTTFFRYFGSKAGVIWSGFDSSLTWFADAVRDDTGQGDTFDALRSCILASTARGLQTTDLWIERFRLLEGNAALRSEAYDHWEQWKYFIARFISRRTSWSPNDPIPMAVAGACQGVLLANMRNWMNNDGTRGQLIDRLNSDLISLGAAFHTLLSNQEQPALRPAT